MKKFINPEMNMVRFDVESIVTGSTAEQAAQQSIAENGVTINGVKHTGVETVTIIF